MGSPPTYNIACPSTICVSLQHRLVSVDSLCSFEMCWAMAVVKEHKSSLEVTGHVVKNYPPPLTPNHKYELFHLYIHWFITLQYTTLPKKCYCITKQPQCDSSDNGAFWMNNELHNEFWSSHLRKQLSSKNHDDIIYYRFCLGTRV